MLQFTLIHCGAEGLWSCRVEDGGASGRAGGHSHVTIKFIRWIMSRNKKKFMIICHVNRLKCSYDKTVVLPYDIDNSSVEFFNYKQLLD